MAIFGTGKKKKDGVVGGGSGSPPINQVSFQKPPATRLNGSQDGHTMYTPAQQREQLLSSANSSGSSKQLGRNLGMNGVDPLTAGHVNNISPPAPLGAGLSQSQGANGGVPLLSTSSNPLSSSLPTNSNLPQTTPPHTVLYPWAQRRLNLLPTALLSPVELSNPSAPPPPPRAGPMSAPPFPRYGHSVNPVASSPSGDLYVFGGLVANAVKNDLYVLNCASLIPGGQNNFQAANAMNPTAPLNVGLVETRGEVPGPRVGHASVGVGNVLIVWGGDTKSRPDEKQDDGLYLLNLSTREWTRVKTIGPCPEGRYGHAAAMVGSKFFVFGGQKDDGGFMNDLAWFDLQKLKAGSPKWSFIEYDVGAVAPPRRTGHTSVTFGDCIYIFGGTDGQYHYNDTWCYDTNTDIWTELSCIGYIPVPREGHSATLVDDVMYVFGGRGVDGKDLEDLAAFKITTQRWFMFQNMGPAPSGRSGHAMATFQNKVYVLGGESYTSQRADDPAFVHVLDTSKIKYPLDSTRQGQPLPRKPSVSAGLNDNKNVAGSSSAINGNSSHLRSTSAADAESGVRDRALSPTGSLRNKGPLTNGVVGETRTVGQNFADSFPNTVPTDMIAGLPPAISQLSQKPGSGPPPRPARPGDEEAAVDDDGNENNGSLLQLQPLVNASSSTRSGAVPQIPELGGIGAMAVRSVSRSSPSEVRSDSPQNSVSGLGKLSNGYGNRNSPIPEANMSTKLDDGTSKQKQIEDLRAREAWMKSVIAMATRKGFVVPGSPSEPHAGRSPSEKAVSEEGNGQLMEALIEMKQDLAKARTTMAEQAQSIAIQLASASKGRAAALQEASYYRAKLAALESDSVVDASKIDRERARDLENKLVDALSMKANLEERVGKLESELDHHSTMRTSAEERHTAALSRADAAESSHSRALKDCADLQRRTQAQDSLLQDHVERQASMESTSQQLVAENTLLKERLAQAESSVEQHMLTVQQAQVALVASSTRGDEAQSSLDQAQAALKEHRTRSVQLQQDLDAKHEECTHTQARAGELERLLKVTSDDHNASKALASSGLAQLLAAHQDAKSRGPSDEVTMHQEKLRAVTGESEKFKKLHEDSRVAYDQVTMDLNQATVREHDLEAQVAQLRTVVATLRSQHAQALEEGNRHKSLASDRENEARQAATARDAAEAKTSVLRNILADNGVPLNIDDPSGGYQPLNGTETHEQLHRRAQDLETRLDQKVRSHRELESAHAESVQNLRNMELKMQSASSEPSAAILSDQSNGAKADRMKAQKSEEELEALRGRHRHLEATHMKAVQYVKGTEKMLRRMKDELTRYKERNDELETQVSLSRAIPLEHQKEVQQLKGQVRDLGASAEKSSRDHQNLLVQMNSLSSDHEQKLRDHQTSSNSRLEDLQKELGRLDAALARANQQLEETKAVNPKLNQELSSAQKGPTSLRQGLKDPSQLERELSQAQHQSEWLNKENQALEVRCRTAEEKISILLDAMEGASPGEEAAGSHSEHYM